MAEVKDLYFLLKDMMAGAGRGDKSRVLQLNQYYERLVPELYPRLSEPVRLNYDNCRQSCVTAMTLFEHNPTPLLADARQRFDQLPLPPGDIGVKVKDI